MPETSEDVEKYISGSKMSLEKHLGYSFYF